jgi:hypothetical protein
MMILSPGVATAGPLLGTVHRRPAIINGGAMIYDPTTTTRYLPQTRTQNAFQSTESAKMVNKGSQMLSERN